MKPLGYGPRSASSSMQPQVMHGQACGCFCMQAQHNPGMLSHVILTNAKARQDDSRLQMQLDKCQYLSEVCLNNP